MSPGSALSSEERDGSKILFVDKRPCRAARSLDATLCPPLHSEHYVSDYPVYYDPLYYPQYHLPLFETIEKTCAWLLDSYLSHHRFCFCCDSCFSGSVAYDGVSMVISHDDVSVFLSLCDLESAAYRHCTILQKLFSRKACSILQHVQLSAGPLLCNIIARFTAQNPSQEGPRRHSCSTLHVRSLRLGELGVRKKLSNIKLPTDCGRLLLPLLAMHFIDLYGQDVASVLRVAPTVILATAKLEGCSSFEWATLPLDDLVRHLLSSPTSTSTLSSPASPLATQTTTTPSPTEPDNEPALSQDTASHLTSPLWESLLGCIKSEGAFTTEKVANIATENNPRPFRSQMNDSAEYWVQSNGDLLTIKFPAQLDIGGNYSRFGHYFNLPTTGIDDASLRKMRAQFELRPLDAKNTAFPEEAVQCSARVLETLFALTTEVEDARNGSAQKSKNPSVIPFWRTYASEDRFSLVVHSEVLLKDIPNPRAMNGPRLSRTDIGKSNILLSPSKVKAKAQSATVGQKGVKKPGDHWKLSDLADPQGRYAGLLRANPALHEATVAVPNIRDGHGVLIHPAEYMEKLNQDDVVEIEVFLKLWSIKKTSKEDTSERDANGSRIYQLHLKGMTVLPTTKYTQPAILNARNNHKGKRKASLEAEGQSPSKKGTARATEGTVDSEDHEDMEWDD